MNKFVTTSIIYILLMILETILSNRVYRSNEFTRLKPRMKEDRVIFAITNQYKLIHCGGLLKAQETDELVDHALVNEAFGLDDETKCES